MRGWHCNKLIECKQIFHLGIAHNITYKWAQCDSELHLVILSGKASQRQTL
jgi:hypothetical protein